VCTSAHNNNSASGQKIIIIVITFAKCHARSYRSAVVCVDFIVCTWHASIMTNLLVDSGDVILNIFCISLCYCSYLTVCVLDSNILVGLHVSMLLPFVAILSTAIFFVSVLKKDCRNGVVKLFHLDVQKFFMLHQKSFQLHWLPRFSSRYF